MVVILTPIVLRVVGIPGLVECQKGFEPCRTDFGDSTASIKLPMLQVTSSLVPGSHFSFC